MKKNIIKIKGTMELYKLIEKARILNLEIKKADKIIIATTKMGFTIELTTCDVKVP